MSTVILGERTGDYWVEYRINGGQFNSEHQQVFEPSSRFFAVVMNPPYDLAKEDENYDRTYLVDNGRLRKATPEEFERFAACELEDATIAKKDEIKTELTTDERYTAPHAVLMELITALTDKVNEIAGRVGVEPLGVKTKEDFDTMTQDRIDGISPPLVEEVKMAPLGTKGK